MTDNWQHFSPSCERNKLPIWQAIMPYIADKKTVLELGSLSGQHACYFTEQLVNTSWQCSDLDSNIGVLNQNLACHGNHNLSPAIVLDVANNSHWPAQIYDVIYSANTLHIMSWQHVQKLFSHINQCLHQDSLVIIYGPFKFNQAFTSDSNAAFELWLKERDSQSGIRDFEAVEKLAQQAGLSLLINLDMPANNQLLIWQVNEN